MSIKKQLKRLWTLLATEEVFDEHASRLEQQSSVPEIRVSARRGPVVPREARGKSASTYYEISLLPRR